MIRFEGDGEERKCHPGEGRSPVGGQVWCGVALRYFRLSNWAPAFAGVGMRIGRRLSQPVDDLETGNALELGGICRHQNTPEGEGMGRDQHIIGADRRSVLFEPGAQSSICRIGRGFERQDGQDAEYRFDAIGQGGRAFFGGAKAEFRRHNDARCDRLLAHISNLVRDAPARIAQHDRITGPKSKNVSGIDTVVSNGVWFTLPSGLENLTFSAGYY